jgi:20S proteasome subunit beta 5
LEPTPNLLLLLPCCAVYHVTEDGWKKVRGDDVTECHFEYYPDPSSHPSTGTPVV